MDRGHRYRVKGVNSRAHVAQAVLTLALGSWWTCTQPPSTARRVVPVLPDQPYQYADVNNLLPAHFIVSGPYGIATADNTPDNNPITDNGATLGRVLFYDTKLSANKNISCGTCHIQQYGFADSRKFSIGFDGQSTQRHAMSLTNARYYVRGRFFWDERAATLESQVLAPIQDPIEMGLSLETLEQIVAMTPYYPPLFERAFGTPTVTTERIAGALAQFVRALVSYRSPYDEARAAGQPNTTPFTARLTDAERLGHRLFTTVPGTGARAAGCSRCHITDIQISLSPRNIGLDSANVGDQGAGDGRFKAPSLRNVAVRAPYMHDGRFATLREVINHYNKGIKPHPFLDMTLLDRRGVVTGRPARPIPLALTDAETDAIIAFLHTLTDHHFLTDPRFANPFLSITSR